MLTTSPQIPHRFLYVGIFFLALAPDLGTRDDLSSDIGFLVAMSPVKAHTLHQAQTGFVVRAKAATPAQSHQHYTRKPQRVPLASCGSTMAIPWQVALHGE